MISFVAGREGFEPPEVLPSTVFKTAAFNHSAISRAEKCAQIRARFALKTARKSEMLEATPRFELGNQGFAGPRLTTWLCRHKIVVLEAGLEPARMQYPRDFKSLVSTNSTTRALISHLKNDDLIFVYFGAGNGFRTRGLDLGKVALYH